MKLYKLDSFIKESMRLHSLHQGTSIVLILYAVGTARTTMKPYTFSDGTVIPKDVSLVTPIRFIHLDETFYDNAEQFNPLRFNILEEKGGQDIKYTASNTSLKFLHFGHGQHAW
jgi:cytochrome P450